MWHNFETLIYSYFKMSFHYSSWTKIFKQLSTTDLLNYKWFIFVQSLDIFRLSYLIVFLFYSDNWKSTFIFIADTRFVITFLFSLEKKKLIVSANAVREIFFEKLQKNCKNSLAMRQIFEPNVFGARPTHSCRPGGACNGCFIDFRVPKMWLINTNRGRETLECEQWRRWTWKLT